MKKKLTKKDIEHLGRLSALQLSETEIEKITKQLDETLQYVENLKELNPTSVSEINHASRQKNVFFDDGGENKRGFTQEKATANSKKKNKGNFVVDRIL